MSSSLSSTAIALPFTCSECGGIFRDKAGTDELSEGDLVLSATGHAWGEWETVTEATEQQEGQQVRFCLHNTSHKQVCTIPKLPHKHTMVKTAKVAPTCAKDGNIMYYTCSGCGCVFTDSAGRNEIDPLDTVLPATEHTWGEGTTTKAATTLTSGIKLYTCTTCGLTKAEIIAKLVKKANQLVAKAKTATVKYTELLKADKKLDVSKVIAFTKKGQGKLSFKKVSGSSKIAINGTTGKVTVKKGLKPGTYKVKAKVKAAGNSSYKASAWKNLTFKVKVVDDRQLTAS